MPTALLRYPCKRHETASTDDARPSGTTADDQLTPGDPNLARDTDVTPVGRGTEDGCGVVTGQTTVEQLLRGWANEVGCRQRDRGGSALSTSLNHYSVRGAPRLSGFSSSRPCGFSTPRAADSHANPRYPRVRVWIAAVSVGPGAGESGL